MLNAHLHLHLRANRNRRTRSGNLRTFYKRDFVSTNTSLPYSV